MFLKIIINKYTYYPLYESSLITYYNVVHRGTFLYIHDVCVVYISVCAHTRSSLHLGTRINLFLLLATVDSSYYRYLEVNLFFSIFT